MLRKKRGLIILLSLVFLRFPVSLAADPGGLTIGTGMWLRFHHGPSTFQLAPGASLSVSTEVLPDFSLTGKLISGAFFGNATGLEVSFAFTPTVGPWMPGAGVAVQGVFGSTVFYYHGGTEYVDVVFPEFSAGIVLQPLRFSIGSFAISAFDMVVGTDLVQFAKVLLVDVDLFRVYITL